MAIGRRDDVIYDILHLGPSLGCSQDHPLFKIDNERTTATKLSASVSGKPTLGDFHNQISPLLPVRSNPPYWPYGVNLEIAKFARPAVQVIALRPIEA